jgi:hypothetical protein
MVRHILEIVERVKSLPWDRLAGPIIALCIFWFWHLRRNYRTPKFRNSGDTVKAKPLLNGRRVNSRENKPVAWGTIRVWNPSDDAIVIEPTRVLLHKIFFKRTSKPDRYLDTIELAPKEDAEFEIELLTEEVPGFHPRSVKFVSSNRTWRKFSVTFEF